MSSQTAPTATTGPAVSTIDSTEIAKFNAMAEAWWDPHGDFKPLHQLNPTRIAFLRDAAARHFGRVASDGDYRLVAR